jgi:hypothetical protein
MNRDAGVGTTFGRDRVARGSNIMQKHSPSNHRAFLGVGATLALSLTAAVAAAQEAAEKPKVDPTAACYQYFDIG